jgi:elongation factor Ts
MANVTPEMVKELRSRSGAGMSDCKKALVEAEGDFAKAEKILKEKGLASAAKRADRATSEGKVFFLAKGSKAVILELTCETDFVAKTDQFNEIGGKLCETIIDKGLTSVTDELETMVKEAVIVLKENMTVKHFKVFDLGAGTAFAYYSHNDGLIGVLVTAQVSGGKQDDEAVKAFLRDVAMHIAAFSPLYLNRESVDAAYIAEQEEILVKQTEALGKPAEIAKNIAKGKLNKHLSEVVLLEQGFVKEPNVTVAKKAEEVGKSIGAELKITGYVNYKVGQA